MMLSKQPAASQGRGVWSFLYVGGALVALLVGALCAGRYPLSPADVWSALFAEHSVARAIVIDGRLPRVIAALVIGAALSTAGATFQAVFRNPLLSPDLLGVLGGSAFGAALGIVLGLHPAVIQILAFVMGLLAVALGLFIARMVGTGGVLGLVLGGVISSALFASALSLVKYSADPLSQLPAIVYWLLGSLVQVGWTDLQRYGFVLVAGVILLSCGGRVLDVLTLDDDEARSLGIPVAGIRFTAIALATLVSAITVSMAGMIGWIGLLVPHIARLMVGAGNARVLPMSALLGAGLLLAADTFARSVSAGEIPLGVVTELFGAVAFVMVLRRLRGHGL